MPDNSKLMTIKLPNGLLHAVPNQAALLNLNYTVYEIFTLKSYERKGWEIAQTDTILDIGAHMGVFALWAAKQAPRGKIISIEPTENIESLTKSIEINKLKNITPLKVAIGKDDSFIELFTSPNYNSSNSNTQFTHSPFLRFLTFLGFNTIHRKHKNQRKTERVKTVSIASIMDKYKLKQIDYLKIDCEGGEYDVFNYLPEKYFPRIKKIAMEFHHFHPSHDYRKLKALFEKHGFEVNTHRTFVQRLTKSGNIWARQKEESTN